jgi:hypothetical protein
MKCLTLVSLLVVAAPGVAAPNLPDREDAAVRAVVEGLFKDAGSADWAGYAARTDPAALNAVGTTSRPSWRRPISPGAATSSSPCSTGPGI